MLIGQFIDNFCWWLKCFLPPASKWMYSKHPKTGHIPKPDSFAQFTNCPGMYSARGGIINNHGQYFIKTLSNFQWRLASSSISSNIINDVIRHHYRHCHHLHHHFFIKWTIICLIICLSPLIWEPNLRLLREQIENQLYMMKYNYIWWIVHFFKSQIIKVISWLNCF